MLELQVNVSVINSLSKTQWGTVGALSRSQENHNISRLGQVESSVDDIPNL